jgi:hypothetical protein
VASVLVGQVFVRKRSSRGTRWAGLLLVLALPLGILLLILGQALSPGTDLGFWSALTIPYALARVLLAVFAPSVEKPMIWVGFHRGASLRIPTPAVPKVSGPALTSSLPDPLYHRPTLRRAACIAALTTATLRAL